MRVEGMGNPGFKSMICCFSNQRSVLQSASPTLRWAPPCSLPAPDGRAGRADSVEQPLLLERAE